MTRFCEVLKAAKGDEKERPKSIIIDCCGAAKTEAEKDLIISEWGHRLAAATDLHSTIAGAGAPPKVDSPTPDSDAGNADGSSDAKSGSDDVDAHDIPVMETNRAEMILSLSEAKKGTEKLSLMELSAVASACELRSYKQLTYNLVKGIFKKAFSLIIARGMRKSDFAWTFVTPPGLLLNTWSMERSPATIDGGCFIPPDSRNAKQHSSIEQKRIALCDAAHICP